MHMRILSSLRLLTEQQFLPDHRLPTIRVPQCHRFITSNDDWWRANLDRFPPGYSPCNVLQSQRIPPVPQQVRELLIDRYCPAALVAEIKASDVNKDCLIRPYLGRRRFNNPERQSRFQAFSLRNFPLHLDQDERNGHLARRQRGLREDDGPGSCTDALGSRNRRQRRRIRHRTGRHLQLDM
ncbi:hypothetical protein VTN77DRAFT_5374 [Rasamsonia byssochlamydoides]|uniref:uncharacterized protein n=1 Tax=Rasamsonia byssochlamydoides TaxID=89139 RepID=UPI00374487F0